MDIVIDFDGTVVTHAFPAIGKDIGAVPVLKELVANGHNLILSTMRSDWRLITKLQNQFIYAHHLTDAVNWFIHKNSIPLYGIQKNPTQESWTSSPKAYGQLIIDDAALGCPLKFDPTLSNRPFVDWVKVRKLLVKHEILPTKKK